MLQLALCWLGRLAARLVVFPTLPLTMVAEALSIIPLGSLDLFLNIFRSVCSWLCVPLKVVCRDSSQESLEFPLESWMSPTHKSQPMSLEYTNWVSLCQHVCQLVIRVDVMNCHFSCCDCCSEVMILNIYVLGSGPHCRGICKT